ncbi:uncharacterized protein RJT21DRAFT_19213 [Scheffersomyces amazonensis]|uniref:uncharacterized protein n=1 Tax=Scheffersomyces amazonensis TaxID=1078765 RepID=UPI00315D32B8
MVKFYLKVAATLEGVTNFQPIDTPESPFEYTFTIQCTKCRTTHDKPITINRFESHEISGSRGEASFVFRCKECKSEHSASIIRTNRSLTVDDELKTVPILEIDARGLDLVEFIPDGQFESVGAESGTKFTGFELDDGEWYDYDDKEGAEVSITEVKWDVARS